MICKMSKKRMSMLLVGLWTCPAFFGHGEGWALPLQILLFGLWVIPIDPSLVPSDDPRHADWDVQGTLIEILTLLEVSEKEEGVVALRLHIRPLKTHSGLEPVPR